LFILCTHKGARRSRRPLPPRRWLWDYPRGPLQANQFVPKLFTKSTSFYLGWFWTILEMSSFLHFSINEEIVCCKSEIFQISIKNQNYWCLEAFKFLKILWFIYRTFRAALNLINSKRERLKKLEIFKAYDQKTKKNIIAPIITLHWHEGHSMMYSFGKGLVRVNWVRCIYLELQGHGFKSLWCSKSVVFCMWPNFYLINFVKPNINFWFYLIIKQECIEPTLWIW
jgi:hypothetical protein